MMSQTTSEFSNEILDHYKNLTNTNTKATLLNVTHIDGIKKIKKQDMQMQL